MEQSLLKKFIYNNVKYGLYLIFYYIDDGRQARYEKCCLKKSTFKIVIYTHILCIGAFRLIMWLSFLQRLQLKSSNLH